MLTRRVSGLGLGTGITRTVVLSKATERRVHYGVSYRGIFEWNGQGFHNNQRKTRRWVMDTSAKTSVTSTTTLTRLWRSHEGVDLLQIGPFCNDARGSAKYSRTTFRETCVALMRLSAAAAVSIPILSVSFVLSLIGMPVRSHSIRNVIINTFFVWTSVTLRILNITPRFEYPVIDAKALETRINSTPGLGGNYVSVSAEHKPDGTYPRIISLLNQTSLIELFALVNALKEGHLLPAPSSHPDTKMPFIFANVEYLLIPLFGWLLVTSDLTVPVIRQSKTHARKAMEKAVKRLLARIPNDSQYPSCYISIEGQRAKTNALSPFKYGVSIMATSKSQESDPPAQIIPFLFQGAREVLPYGHLLPRPGSITMLIYPAITVFVESPQSVNPEQQKANLKAFRNAITQNLQMLAEQELNKLHQEEMLQ